jgi:cytochrome b561
MEQELRHRGKAKRYNAIAQLLHWVTALCMFAALPLAWVMYNMPESASDRDAMFMWHKSFGLSILALTVIRSAWRLLLPAPAFPPSIARWETTVARATYLLLYCTLFAMPISGYILSSAGGHPVTFFDLFTLPALPKNDALSKTATWIHVAIGQYVLYGLIALHVIGVVWHVAARRDGIHDRMLPEQRHV